MWVQRWRPGTIRITVIAGATPPIISTRAGLRFRSDNSTCRSANCSAGDRARPSAQRTTKNTAECTADNRSGHRSGRGLRWGWRRHRHRAHRRRWHGYRCLHRDEIALWIVRELGNNLRRTIDRPVVEIPEATSPPPIAATSPATPVGIRPPERPQMTVKMARVEAVVLIAHHCSSRLSRRPSRLLRACRQRCRHGCGQ